MARILSLDAVAGLLRARPSELMASGLAEPSGFAAFAWGTPAP